MPEHDPEETVVAVRDRTQTPPQRVVRALVRPGKGQVAVAILLAALGFAGVTQIRLYGSQDAYSGLPQSDLVEALNGLSAASAHAQAELSQLERTRRSLQDNSNRGTVALEHARTELDTLGILAGTLPAVGPGLRIVVHDPKGHYQVFHLLDGIEELRDAGAEAIQLNGQVRVVAQTSFKAGNGGILVDGRLLTAPYTLDVIGNPATLKAALSFPGGFNDEVAVDDGTTTVTEMKSLQITVLRSGPQPRYAQVSPTS
ncbi:MAG: DUF881 domain-containing protein [Marmoricola sp.]